MKFWNLGPTTICQFSVAFIFQHHSTLPHMWPENLGPPFIQGYTQAVLYMTVITEEQTVADMLQSCLN